MSSTPNIPTDLVELKQFLEDVNDGFLSTKYLALSSFVLLLYDHLICLDQEIEFFWEGDWSLTRILYFLNRYVPPWVFVVHLTYFFEPMFSLEFCTAAIKATTIMEVVGMFVVEAVLVTRVFYLWSHNRMAQALLCIVFSGGIAAAIGFAGKAINALAGAHLPSPYQTGCLNVGNGMYWPIFVPVFIVQTFLFAMTLVRVMRPMTIVQNKSVVKRLVRDGGIFYLVVCLSVGFTVVGSLQLTHVRISLPALFSNSLLAIHSICASRLILSIHSLASDMGSDPTFLLSNIEISRVTWRRGSTANELVVDVHVDEGAEMEMEDRADNASVKTTMESDSHPSLPNALLYSRTDTRTSIAEVNLPECGFPLVDADPFAKEQRNMTGTSTSRPGSKEGRGTIRATRFGVYEPRPAYKELGFRTYSYRQ